MSTGKVRLRPVSRVILVDPAGRVLLFDTALAYTRAWIAPGGALEEGESHESGALRELEEETGLTGVTLSTCVWTLRFQFEFRGVIYDQTENYFAARTEDFRLTSDGWTESERGEIRAQRWWSLDEILNSSASFRPDNLALLLPDILSGTYPQAPIVTHLERAARTLDR
jgi:ADP-ribose pyrophosphatase YjhB (NUDIX family)